MDSALSETVTVTAPVVVLFDTGFLMLVFVLSNVCVLFKVLLLHYAVRS